MKLNYNIIAIEREYASGGSEIGEKIGKWLDIPCYGQEVLERAAKLMNTIPERLLHLEETTSNSLLYSIGMAAKVMTGQVDGLSEEGALYLTEERVIKDMALQGPCVIVGRCADYILHDKADCLKVFIHASMDFRAKRIVEVYGEQEKTPMQRLKEKDKRRAAYHRFYTDMKWGHAQNYHITLDSGELGIDKCVEILQSLY